MDLTQEKRRVQKHEKMDCSKCMLWLYSYSGFDSCSMYGPCFECITYIEKYENVEIKDPI